MTMMKDCKKILFDVISAKRAGNLDSINKEDISYAKEHGFLFDYPKYETHEDTYNRLQNILSKINSKDVADAFLYSLSTRKLEYRSALGSYYYAKAIPAHDYIGGHYEKTGDPPFHCYFCGWEAWIDKPEEFKLGLGNGYDSFNYLRYKYGGGSVFTTNIKYAVFDLEQFIKLPKVGPCKEDIHILNAILASIDFLEPKDKIGKLCALITKEKILSSNKNEVSSLLGNLGICGVLTSKEFPDYCEHFVDEYDRAPIESKNDYPYPVNMWHASDGVNTEKLIDVFGL